MIKFIKMLYPVLIPLSIMFGFIYGVYCTTYITPYIIQKFNKVKVDDKLVYTLMNTNVKNEYVSISLTMNDDNSVEKIEFRTNFIKLNSKLNDILIFSPDKKFSFIVNDSAKKMIDCNAETVFIN